MPCYKDLKGLQNNWFEFAKKTHPNQAYALGAPISRVALALLAINAEKYESDKLLSEDHIALLVLALEIDTKHFIEYPLACRQLLNQFKPLFNERFIIPAVATLDEAADFIISASWNYGGEISGRRTVARVMRAIEQATRLTKKQLEVKSVIKLDVKEEGEVFCFYFHGEKYASYPARKDAITRLHSQIINYWNNGAQSHPQLLINFVLAVNAGPCIEGATRDALATWVSQVSVAQTEKVKQTFNVAMYTYYVQANAYLTLLRLPITQYALEQLIRDAYEGTQCTDGTITTTSVKSYFDQTQLFDSLYWLDKEAKPDAKPNKEEFDLALPYLTEALSLHMRVALISTLLPYASGWLTIRLERCRKDYTDLFQHRNTPLLLCAALENKLLLESLPFFDNQLLFLDSCYLDHKHLVKELLTLGFSDERCCAFLPPGSEIYLNVVANKQLFLLQEKVASSTLTLTQLETELCREISKDIYPGINLLYFICRMTNDQNTLHTLVEKYPGLIVSDTFTHALCCPVTDGSDVGISPLCQLARRKLHLPFLSKLINNNPTLLTHASFVEALCRPITTGPNADVSPLWYLAVVSQEKRLILNELIEKQPALLTEPLFAEALCRPITTGPNAGFSPLRPLAQFPESQPILRAFIEKIPAATLNSPAVVEALCRPFTTGLYAGTSPLFLLIGTPESLATLRALIDKNPAALFTHPSFVEALCRPIPNTGDDGASLLYFLIGTSEGRPLLVTLINNYPALLTEDLFLKALCRPITGGLNAGNSPLGTFVAKEETLPIFRTLINNYPALVTKPFFVEALCHLVTAGPNVNTSPIWWLTGKLEGIHIFSMLIERNPALVAEPLFIKALCHPVTDGPDAGGTSPLWWLAKNSEGQRILCTLINKNPSLLTDPFFVEALCRPATTGPDAGTSPLWWLAEDPQGQPILSALISTNRGLLIQTKFPSFVEALYRQVTGGPSLLYWLTKNSAGDHAILCSLLDQNFELCRNPLFIKALYSVTPHAGSMAYAHASPLYWLIKTTHKPNFIIDMLFAALNNLAKSFNITIGSRAHNLYSFLAQRVLPDLDSVLFYYCKNRPEDLSKLITKKWFSKSFNAHDLCQPINSGPDAGTSPLFYLMKTDTGRTILKILLENNPKLASGITAEALCRPNTEGVFPLCWLMKNSDSSDSKFILETLLKSKPSLKVDITNILRQRKPIVKLADDSSVVPTTVADYTLYLSTDPSKRAAPAAEGAAASAAAPEGTGTGTTAAMLKRFKPAPQQGESPAGHSAAGASSAAPPANSSAAAAQAPTTALTLAPMEHSQETSAPGLSRKA